MVDILVDKTWRFSPAYDLRYRFKTPSTFNPRGQMFRPHTSDGNSCFHKMKGQLELEEIAHAQESSVEAFRRSLEESLMIIQQGRTEINPSTFTNLDKIHIQTLQEERARRRQQTRSSQRSANRRPWTCDEGLYAARRNLFSAKSQAEVTDFTTARRERADELKKSFVQFISKAESQNTMRPKTYHHHPDYLSNRGGPEDKCQRCTGHPEIQIDGRSFRGTSGDGLMARHHCDVLGMTMCPDCIRTRARNDHFKKCNASVSERLIDVYKLALVKQRIPTTMPINDTVLYSYHVKPKLISVSSLDNSGKHVTKISIEATEMRDDNKIPDVPTPKPSPRAHKLIDLDNIVSDASSTEDNAVLEMKPKEPSDNEESKSENLNSEGDNKTVDKETTPDKQSTKTRKKSPKRKSRLFNRGTVPSPNYFCDVSDLQHRIRAHRISKRRHFLAIEALAEEINTRQQDDKVRIESTHEDTSSLASQDSISPKTRNSPKIYEPPVLFGQRPSVLGVAVE